MNLFEEEHSEKPLFVLDALQHSDNILGETHRVSHDLEVKVLVQGPNNGSLAMLEHEPLTF